MFPTMTSVLALALFPGADPQDWKAAEAAHLRNIRQLTHDFVRAGEGYFSPDGQQIIFQAEEKDSGNPFYQIFVMDLGTGRYRRISPGVGKTTCAFFRPDGKKVIFASSHEDPEARKLQAEEYARRAEDAKKGVHRRYAWDFDPHMKIYEANPDGTELRCLTPWAKVYTAEGNYSPDGKRIVFASGTADNTHIYVMDADGSNVRQVTRNAPVPRPGQEARSGSYNGGPFFSPDGQRVIFRADRKERDRLQLYLINLDGSGETPLTDNDHWVYWAPYWYKDGQHIIYTAADHSVMGRPNYDLYWMNIEQRKPVRITYAPGADVLPVFSPDGKKVMWTSSRDGSSQLYVADFVPPTGP